MTRQLGASGVRWAAGLVIAAVSIAPLSPAPAANAQPAPASRATAIGVNVSVRDTAGAAIDGAEVVVRALGVARRTDRAGRLALGAIRAGDYVIVARRFGFLPDSQHVVARPGAVAEVAFTLRSSAQRLDAALVEGEALRDKMVDFERRRAIGRGTFITRDDIERRHPIALADILRTVPGLRVRAQGGRTEVRFGRADVRYDGPDCPPEIWVDGVRTFGATVDEFPPAEVEGIELYHGPGQLPAQFLSRTTGCGLLIVWTRSPSRIER